MCEWPCGRTPWPPLHPASTETEIHGIAIPVHGTVQINPSSAHLQIRLVDTPGSADFACIASPALFELRHILLDPMHDGRMPKFQFAFCHLDKIAQAELIAKVPSDTQEDHLSVGMTPRKQFPNEAFGYWKVKVERPLRLHSQLSRKAIETLRFASGDEEIRTALYEKLHRGEKPGEHTAPRSVNPRFHPSAACRLGKYHHFHRRLRK
jgi:hypothetical protein